MLASLRREFQLKRGVHLVTFRGKTYNGAGEEVNPYRDCRHTPDQMYTRAPCACGRPIWPIKGRGRGESLLSVRRVNAKVRASEAMRLYAQGWTLEAIAKALGYRDPSGPWRAMQRARDIVAAHRLREDRVNYHRGRLDHMLATYQTLS
jgi:hypothetical protein